MFRPRFSGRASSMLALLVTTVLWTACVQDQTPITSLEDFEAALVMPEVDAQEVGSAVRAQNRHSDRLMGQRGVVAMAVGASSNGRGAAVQVYVEDRSVTGIPQELDGVPVDIIVTGPIVALQESRKKGGKGGGGGGGGGDGGSGGDNTDPTTRFERPVPIGVSTGHPDITAGTIGARVTNGSTVYALSNNHVFANENAAVIGDDVLQPGPYDGGGNGDELGTLAAFIPIDFGGNNTVDAAIALVTTTDLGTSTPSNGYGTPKSQTLAASVGMRVQKYGRTTGQTRGRVQGINASVNVGYSNGTARFVGQIIIGGGGFSAGGDSGSLIVGQRGSQARRPVGLLFAGGGGITIANPIDAVLSALSAEVPGTLSIDGN